MGFNRHILVKPVKGCEQALSCAENVPQQQKETVKRQMLTCILCKLNSSVNNVLYQLTVIDNHHGLDSYLAPQVFHLLVLL